MTIVLIPSRIVWRSWLEHEAIRLFGRVAGATRPKIRMRLVEDAMCRGASFEAAQADADDALAFVEARIELYRAAREIEPLPAPRRAKS